MKKFLILSLAALSTIAINACPAVEARVQLADESVLTKSFDACNQDELLTINFADNSSVVLNATIVEEQENGLVVRFSVKQIDNISGEASATGEVELVCVFDEEVLINVQGIDVVLRATR
jgi:hypothetical protein